MIGPGVMTRPFFHHCHERQFLTMARNIHTKNDIEQIIDGCTGVGSVLDELTLLRASLRAYLEGMTAEEAVAWACQELSNSLTNR